LEKSKQIEKAEKTVKSNKNEEAPKPAETEPVTQFETRLNTYGFLHMSKKAIPYLPFKVESPLVVQIEGSYVIIEAKK
jgi:hypothetical protein